MVDFRGYAYTREPSPISGMLVTRYDTSKPMTWHVPLREEVRATFAIDAPLAGYVDSTGVAEWLADRLRLHGIRFEKLESARAALGSRPGGDQGRTCQREFRRPGWQLRFRAHADGTR